MPRRAGDVVLTRVLRVNNHTRIVDQGGQRRRIYSGDILVGVLGNRYATDAFYGVAEVEDGRVHLMTNAGMVGRVTARHGSIKPPTELEVLGTICDRDSSRPINLIQRGFRRRPSGPVRADVLLVLGTGMNAGKTTSATKLVRGLLARDFKVAALKMTGSVSPGDRGELADTGADYVADFSDYGFPSTHLLAEEDLTGLAYTMLQDADDTSPDVIVVEIADGVLQRETRLLLHRLKDVVHGAVLAAPCALSASAGAEFIEQAGIEVHAITGIISNSPLFVSELESLDGRQVASSTDDGRTLGELLAKRLTSPRPCRAA